MSGFGTWYIINVKIMKRFWKTGAQISQYGLSQFRYPSGFYLTNCLKHAKIRLIGSGLRQLVRS